MNLTTMIAFMNQKFQGKKTYATAIVAILTALITYFNGEATLMSALQLGFTAVMGMTIRNGVANAVTSAETK